MPNIIDTIPENLEIINKADLTMAEVIRCVNTVVKLGKISKTKQGDPQYCANTYFEDGVTIFAGKNEKGQDSLIVTRSFNSQEAINFIEKIRGIIKLHGFGKTRDGRFVEHADTMSRYSTLNSIKSILKRGEKFEKIWRELEEIYGSKLMSDIEEKYLRRSLDYKTRSCKEKTIYYFH